MGVVVPLHAARARYRTATEPLPVRLRGVNRPGRADDPLQLDSSLFSGTAILRSSVRWLQRPPSWRWSGGLAVITRIRLVSRIYAGISTLSSSFTRERSPVRTQPRPSFAPGLTAEAGDQVVVELSERVESAGSSFPLENEYAHVWTFRNGLVTRLEIFRQLEDALAAAGISE